MGKRRLPAGFTELDYLESSGTQCIDTLTVPQGDTRMHIYAEQISAIDGVNTLIGCRNKILGSNYDFHVYVTKSNPGKIGLYPYTNTPLQALPAGQFTAAFTGSAIEIDGEFKRSYAQVQGELESNNPVRLFAMNYGNGTYSQYSIFKIYRFRLSSPTALLMDLIPVLDENDEPCMWDKVSGRKFPNAKTGRFGYRIKSTGEEFPSNPPNATTFSLRAPRDPYYVAPSGVYARLAGDNELEIIADTEEVQGDGWELFANTAEAYEHFDIVPAGANEPLA